MSDRYIAQFRVTIYLLLLFIKKYWKSWQISPTNLLGKIKFYNTLFKLLICTEVLFSDTENFMTYIFTTWSRVLLEKLTGSQLVKTFPAFYEPEGSLPHIHLPATCPFPHSNQFSPYPHIPLPEDPRFYNLPIYAWIFQVISFSQVSRPKPVLTSHLFHTYYMSRPSYSSWFFFQPNNIWWGYISLSSSLCSVLHSSITSSLLHLNILLNTLFSDTLNLCSSLNVSDQVSHPYKTTGKIIVLYILIFKCLDSEVEDKRFCTEW